MTPRRPFQWIDDATTDARCAIRGFVSRPGIPVVALLTLAIGVGATTTILSVVNAVILKQPSYPTGDRLVALWEKRPSGERNALSTRSYLAYAEESGVFEHMVPTVGPVGGIALTGGDRPVLLRGFRVGVRYFNILGAHAALGRTFSVVDGQPASSRVVVLSHALWNSQFGADRSLIGRSIVLNGRPHMVIGVMPADSPFDRSWVQLWLPLVIDDDSIKRTDHWLMSFTGGALGLLKPGVSIEEARARLSAVSTRLAQVYPETNKGWGVDAVPFGTAVVGDDLRQSLYLLLGAVGSLLLLVCVNLAHILTTRGIGRQEELAIRSALGAGRGRLIRQFLAESILLALCGAVLGVGVAYVTLPALLAALPDYTVPAEAVVTIDGRVLASVTTLSVLTGIVCGVFPAIWAMPAKRTVPIASGRAASAPREQQLVRQVFIVSEVALASVLLIGAGLLVRSFVNMQRDDGGISQNSLLTGYVPARGPNLATPEQLLPYFREVADAIRALPSVDSVALSDGLPFRGVTRTAFFQVSGRAQTETARRPLALFKAVSGSYFSTLGLHVLRGRALNERDRAGASYVVVINETMASRFFRGENPIGRHLLMQQTRPGTNEEIPWEIVGVIADERIMPLVDKRTYAAVYVPFEQSPAPVVGVVVRTRLDPARAEGDVRRAIFSVNKDQPLTEMRTIEQEKAGSMASDRLRLTVLGAFALVATLLSGIGIFGVVAYAVERRTKEFGIRSALGASGGQLLGLAMRSGMALTAVGLVVGVIAAAAVTRFLAAFLYGITASDPVSIALTLVVLALVATTACYLPARRAARVDPAIALRST
jgi:putative ABC transport system permease protein